MAITIDYGNTWIIDIPKADLTLVTGTLYELDTEAFRLELKDIEDGEIGMAFPKTHIRNAPVILAGLTLAQTFEIIAPYSVRFENGSYSVRLAGSNNNIFDVESGILEQNNVQVIAQNSAGLISLNDILRLQQVAAFGGSVHIDSVIGNDSNDGTHGSPVKTAAAARVLADANGLTSYHFVGSITLTQAHDRWGFFGDSASFNDVVNLNNQSVDESKFQGCQLAGDALESNIEALFCSLDNPGNLHGVFRQCGLINNFKVEATTPEVYIFHHCFSQVAGSGRPTLDFTNVAVTHNVQFRNYVGGINVANMVQGNLSIDTPAGTIDLKSTITGGDVVVGGEGLLINSMGGTATLTSRFQNKTDFDLIKYALVGKVVIANNDLTFDIRDDDDNVLATFSRSADGRLRLRIT